MARIMPTTRDRPHPGFGRGVRRAPEARRGPTVPGMEMIDCAAGVARQIAPGFTGAGVVSGADVHLGVLRVEAGAEIPRHPAGPDQALLVVGGRGEVSGGDGAWRPIEAGQAAIWRSGEQHTTRAIEDLTLVVLELPDLTVHPRAVRLP